MTWCIQAKSLCSIFLIQHGGQEQMSGENTRTNQVGSNAFPEFSHRLQYFQPRYFLWKHTCLNFIVFLDFIDLPNVFLYPFKSHFMSWSSVAHLPIIDRITSFSSFCILLSTVSSGSLLFYQDKFWAASLSWCVCFYRSLCSSLHYFFSKQGVLHFQPIPSRKMFHIFGHPLNCFLSLSELLLALSLSFCKGKSVGEADVQNNAHYLR